MTTTKTRTSPPPSLAAWQARSEHTITCPSGQRLKIRIPGIATLLEHGDLPDDLIELALLELTTEGGAAAAVASEFTLAQDKDKALERIKSFGLFQRNLVCAAVTAVENGKGWEDLTLTPDDLDALPEDDLALVAEIVQRLRSHDARGVRIGVEPLDRWASFREAHGCDDETCEGCKKLVAELSSVDLGEV